MTVLEVDISEIKGDERKKVAHLVINYDELMHAMLYGTYVTAICGYTYIPRSVAGVGNGVEKCQKCVELEPFLDSLFGG